MTAFSAGTLAGAGTFTCDSCGTALVLQEEEEVQACPECGGRRFRRALLAAPGGRAGGLGEPDPPDWLYEERARLEGEGDFLAFWGAPEPRVVPVAEGWTRVGRGISADLRLEDPTVSRRHALLYRDESGVRVLDDRSLNGVFRNGERISHALLRDGDEISIGRFRLFFVSHGGKAAGSRLRATARSGGAIA